MTRVSGPTNQQQPAIRAWQASDSAVTLLNSDIPNDRRMILGYKVKQNTDGSWHYEYAVQNLNSDRSGNSFEVPLPAGATGGIFRAAMLGRILPAIAAHDPQMILISAGFDAHADDPLAGLQWQAEDYRWLTDRLCDFAGGRVVSTLEGGYDLDALAASVAAHVAVLEERGR